MYTLELTLKYTPFPISIQKKEFEEIQTIFNDIKNAMQDQSNENLVINLQCEKIQSKAIAVMSKEIIAVQIYEKSASAGGSKRPGFSLDR